MSREEEVRQASEQFYAALSHFLNGDIEPMMEVWSHGPDVTAMVPSRQVGWEEVRATWEQIASLNSGGQVTVPDLLVRAGSDLAYTIGTERVEVTLRVSRCSWSIASRISIAEKQGAGRWCIITLISPALQDIINRLQPPSG